MVMTRSHCLKTVCFRPLQWVNRFITEFLFRFGGIKTNPSIIKPFRIARTGALHASMGNTSMLHFVRLRCWKKIVRIAWPQKSLSVFKGKIENQIRKLP